MKEISIKLKENTYRKLKDLEKEEGFASLNDLINFLALYYDWHKGDKQ